MHNLVDEERGQLALPLAMYGCYHSNNKIKFRKHPSRNTQPGSAVSATSPCTHTFLEVCTTCWLRAHWLLNHSCYHKHYSALINLQIGKWWINNWSWLLFLHQTLLTQQLLWLVQTKVQTVPYQLTSKISSAVRAAPVVSDWSITDLHEQMGSATSLVSTIHRGVRGIISVWFSSDHEYSCFVFSPRQCDESGGQSSTEHMWLDMDQIIILALIYHWYFLGTCSQGY